MLDQLIGLILLGLGFTRSPAIPGMVLGENTTVTSISTSTKGRELAALKLMRPKFTPEEQTAFQKERAKREANYVRLMEARVNELDSAFFAKLEKRYRTDEAIRAQFTSRVNTFQDEKKRRALIALSETYRQTVQEASTSMHNKLTSMLTLLDRISAAAGALDAQGTDMAATESSVSSAQAAVVSALAHVAALAESLSTAFLVTDEAHAKEEIQAALAQVKIQMAPARSSFYAAHVAVGAALAQLELVTDAVEVGLWPAQK